MSDKHVSSYRHQVVDDEGNTYGVAEVSGYGDTKEASAYDLIRKLAVLHPEVVSNLPPPIPSDEIEHVSNLPPIDPDLNKTTTTIRR